MPAHRRALLFMHHILSSKKKDFIGDEARALGVSGWCKVGHPGVLVVQGTDGQVTEYVKKIKRLRWQSCVVNASTGIEAEELAASFGDRVREVDEMKQLGHELERAGGDWIEWFRRGMGYHS